MSHARLNAAAVLSACQKLPIDQMGPDEQDRLKRLMFLAEYVVRNYEDNPIVTVSAEDLWLLRNVIGFD